MYRVDIKYGQLKNRYRGKTINCREKPNLPLESSYLGVFPWLTSFRKIQTSSAFRPTPNKAAFSWSLTPARSPTQMVWSCWSLSWCSSWGLPSFESYFHKFCPLNNPTKINPVGFYPVIWRTSREIIGPYFYEDAAGNAVTINAELYPTWK